MKNLLVPCVAIAIFVCAGCGGSTQSPTQNEPADEAKATRPKNINDLAEKAGVQPKTGN